MIDVPEGFIKLCIAVNEKFSAVNVNGRSGRFCNKLKRNIPAKKFIVFISEIFRVKKIH